MIQGIIDFFFVDSFLIFKMGGGGGVIKRHLT